MPNFIKTQKDEEDWKRAKSIVMKGYPGMEEKSEKFWKLVNSIYFSISKKHKNNPLAESLMNEVEKIEIARTFVSNVKNLAKEMGLNVFVVTDGASGILNNGCEAVKAARDAHIKWELEHGSDPEEDWGKNK